MAVATLNSSTRRLDPVAFPRLSSYLANLPNGLLAYPECECKASIHREAFANLPTKMRTDGLDSLLTDYFENPVPVNSWIPEVVNSAIYLAIADACFPTESGFLDWIGAFSENTYRSPMYRVLMIVASPLLLAQGGERRWRTFHTGTEYATKIGDAGTETTLSYPPHCMDALVVKGVLRAIQAAYRATGARKATVELVQWTPTKSVYRANWYPKG